MRPENRSTTARGALPGRKPGIRLRDATWRTALVIADATSSAGMTISRSTLLFGPGVEVTFMRSTIAEMLHLDGGRGETRTHTSLPTPAPKAGASTISPLAPKHHGWIRPFRPPAHRYAQRSVVDQGAHQSRRGHPSPQRQRRARQQTRQPRHSSLLIHVCPRRSSAACEPQ